MDLKINSAQQALLNNSLQSCKPALEEICNMWLYDHLFGPSIDKVGTPDSVLAPLQGDSPPLSHHGSSPPPVLDHVESLIVCHSYLCNGAHNIDTEHYVTIGDDSMQDSHNPYGYSHFSPPPSSTNHHLHAVPTPWEVHTPILEDNVTMVELSVDESPLVAIDTSDMDKHELAISDLHKAQNLDFTHLDMIKQKQHVVASPCGVAAMLRQHVKTYLDRALHEELALCGCAHMTQEDEEGSCNPEDHYLECKMRTDYAMWVMWMQERSIRNEGLDLVQRLLACAEAVACRDVRQAQVLLQGVRELASPYGDSLQRVAFCFMEGLAARLFQHNVSGSTPANIQAIPMFPTAENGGINKFVSQSRMYAHGNASKEILRRQQEAFHFMCKVCPYVPFGHFIANSVIMEAVEGEQMVHVIDLGMTEGPQWQALIQGLATRPGGAPKLLRITGIGTFASQLEEIGKVLRQEATVVSLNFEFKAVHEPVENIAQVELDLRDGEVVVVNSVLRLHCVVKESRGSLNTVLHAVHGLSPKVLTLVEQDANHNGPFFLGRFMEALHYYSAIFDSLQTALPRHSTRRANIEQCHLAHEIGNIVACEGPARVERHERVDQWRRRMSRAGFQLAPIRLEGQARLWLSTNYAAHMADDYTLSDEKGCLLLGWKGKPIIAASAWRC